ncbi:MAG: Zn-ribbon domain-containing OB-fold protein [Lautropia sp.]
MTLITDRTLASPVPNPETAAFWDATKQGRFTLRYCRDCGRTHWYPRAICPHCFSANTEWRDASGKGEIHAFSVMARATPPYVVAFVTLAEGPTMLTNLVECDTDALAIGQAVEVVFRATDNGTQLPMFRPARG